MADNPKELPRLVAIIGTRAQVIKMAPLLAELERRDLPYQLLLTGQHHETVDALLDEFGIRTPRESLYSGPEVKGMTQAARWILLTTWRLWRRRRDWAPHPPGETIVLTHGDTFTTLLAAFSGRLVGARIAHIEGGLRSWNWRNPFPEEITRVLVTRLAHVAYCPGPWAQQNLKGQRVDAVDTQANTILDALRLATERGNADQNIPEEDYAVVSVHRFENLYSRERLDRILGTIDEIATRVRVVVVLHPTTRKRLREVGQLKRLELDPEIELRPRMTYVPFMQLVRKAKLVITDGGSNQEELSYLGIPTLLMRMATERQEGLGENITLSEFRPEAIHGLIESTLAGGKSTQKPALPEFHPSRIIVDHLEVLLATRCLGQIKTPRP